jgi:hypothetical protein
VRLTHADVTHLGDKVNYTPLVLRERVEDCSPNNLSRVFIYPDLSKRNVVA